MSLFLKPVSGADSTRPTLFNPMFQSLPRSVSTMKSGWEIHWLRSLVKKQELSNQDVPVVSAPQQPEAEEVIRSRAAECDAPLQFVNETYNRSPVALRGEYQKHNAAVAIAAIQAANIQLNENAIVRGLASIEWPARFQKWDERTIIDGAHNPSACAHSGRKRGGKFLAIRRRRSCSRFFPTKICAVSAKRSRRLPVR